MNLGENIYRLRTEKNMSQGDLADALDVSRQSVSKWENSSAVPELEKLVKMAELFGVSIDTLVNGESGNQEHPANEPQERIIYVEKPVPSPISGVKLMGGILLICSVLLALLLASYEHKFNLTEVVLFALPVAVCGIFCMVAKHPLLWCSWICSANYWIYFFILSNHWEEQVWLMILGGIFVIAALLYTVKLDRNGIIHVPAWVWAVLTLVLVSAAFLLLINTLPPAQGVTYPAAPGPVG